MGCDAFQVDNVRIEVNHRIPSWCCRIAYCGAHTSGDQVSAVFQEDMCNEDNGAFLLRPAITSDAHLCMFDQLWCLLRVGVC